MEKFSKSTGLPTNANQSKRKMISNHTFDFQLDQLRNEYRKLQHIIEQFDEGMIITDPNQVDNPVIYMNPGFTKLTKYTREEVIGKNCRFLRGKDTDSQAMEDIRIAIKNKEPITTELLNYKKDGTPFWNELKIRPIFDDYGELLYFVGIQTDVTIRRNALEMAYYDPLTSIPNRRYLLKTLEERLKNEDDVTLMLFDIDDFKIINDTYGHIAGDELLLEISQRITQAVPSHFTARLAGDEFVVLLSTEDKEEIYTIVTNIIESFTSGFQIPSLNTKYITTFSIGISCSCRHGRTSEELIHKADIAMYEAKKTFGTFYCFYDWD
ncbi:GGDEF domain-containing protein [Bacillus sp. FJAT-45350]|uniref:GGDEF domain-containing protein n=1 Tax=Bacillus sp. FJAT-45350 TaxID=2011014 RepID=UPI000BB6EBF5|nr:GGDEF domain-containing protein [Bacillus sp. FJAT-45350]